MPAPQDGVMASVGTVSAEGTRLNLCTPETAVHVRGGPRLIHESELHCVDITQPRPPGAADARMRGRASARA